MTGCCRSRAGGEYRLDWDRGLAPLDIAVADGVVALSGRVPSRAQSEQAERITRSLQGVEGIINQLEVVLR